MSGTRLVLARCDNPSRKATIPDSSDALGVLSAILALGNLDSRNVITASTFCVSVANGNWVKAAGALPYLNLSLSVEQTQNGDTLTHRGPYA